MIITVCDHCGKNKDSHVREFGGWLSTLSRFELCSDCYKEAAEKTKDLRELLESKFQELEEVLKEYEFPTPEFEETLKKLNKEVELAH